MIDIQKFIKSVGFSVQGIFTLLKSENNARIHLLATFFVTIAGFYFQISKFDWLWIGLSVALVWLAEAFNTAIETIVDLVSPEIHPLAKKIKDLSAAAVLIAAGFAVFVAMIVFLL